ncbi:MAG: hypothetical protein A2Y38_10610 [Spirochaetes bacterium GWB1_59_5]|nr:MAG: hypothetical protein A2Y38_10610 [Spirochaetes bacterium GWB1_59_5]
MSLFSRESLVALATGERAAVSVDPREYELVAGPGGPGSDSTYGIPFKRLRAGSVVPIPQTGLTLRVERVYPNSRVVSPLEGGGGFTLAPEPAPPRAEAARPGLVGTVEGSGQPLFLYGGAASPTSVNTARGSLALMLRPIRRRLPFTIELVRFERDLYPGGEIARGYSSVVALRDQGTERRVTVAMNRPARQGGYAIYQSSWGSTPEGKDVSVLQVVHNPLRLLPYLGLGTALTGMALHYGLKKVGRRERRAGGAA